MLAKEVRHFTAALDLQRRVVGLKFLYTWAEYQDSSLQEYGDRTSLCYMMLKASQGQCFKAREYHFTCGRSREALGLVPPKSTTISGELYFSCGIYESRAVAKQVQDEVLSIPQSIYGVEMGPLEELQDADVVMMVVDAFQAMRIVQGYAYCYGAPKNICMVGNQGVCADLAARPYVKNDINLSVLCAGTRRACKWDRGELGIGLPINRFAPVVDGVIQTLNGIEYPTPKDEILQRLESPDELGIVIDKQVHYGKNSELWAKKRQEDQERYEAWQKEQNKGAVQL